MTIAKNIIRRQIIDLQYTGEAEGFVLQKQLGNWCNEKLLPAIETALDEYANEDYIKIDTVEIDTTITGVDDWQPVLLQRIMGEVKEKIAAVVISSTPQPEPVRYNSRDQNFKELLFYFLRYGYLPWWGTINSKPEFNERLEKWMQEAEQASLKDILPLLNNQATRKRIAYQFAREAFAFFIAGLINLQPHTIAAVLKDVSVAGGIKSISSSRISEYEFKMMVLENLNTAVTEKILYEFVEKWLEQSIEFNTVNNEILNDEKLFSKEFRVLLEKIKSKKNIINQDNKEKGKEPPRSPENGLNAESKEAIKPAPNEKRPVTDEIGKALTGRYDNEETAAPGIESHHLPGETKGALTSKEDR
ncbi:MAG: contractile injection system tape measure protein, partial [Ferruginibacter sp.]